MIQKLIDAVRNDIFTERWDETNKQLSRIADALQRLAPQVVDEAGGDNSEVYIDPYTPESELDESVGLGEEEDRVARSK